MNARSAAAAQIVAPLARAGVAVATQDGDLVGLVRAAAAGAREGRPVVAVSSAAALLDAVRARRLRLAIVDDGAAEEAVALIAEVRRLDDQLPVVFVAERHASHLERAVRCAGALAYLARPLERDRIARMVRASVGAQEEA